MNQQLKKLHSTNHIHSTLWKMMKLPQEEFELKKKKEYVWIKLWAQAC